MLTILRKTAAFFVLIFLPHVVLAQTVPGYDVLGVAMYCDRYLAAPQLPGVSTLLVTFGDPLPCIQQALARGGLRVVQIDLIDATCWRNGVCPPGVPKPDDTREITKRAQRIQPLALKYPSTEFWLSPALEHDIKDPKKVSAMLAAAKAGCPACKAIQSPMSGAVVQGTPIERHGTTARSFSISGDGSSMFDGDNLASDGNGFEHRTAGSYSTFAWWPELNLRCTGEKTFTPPLKRTNRPTSDQFRQAALTMGPEQSKPAAPAQCVKTRDIQPNEIMKPNAEFYCNGVPNDGRGNKGLLIIQKPGTRGQKLPILRSDGKQVGSFGYYGTYPAIKGAHRWYVGIGSGQFPAQLYDALGGEWGYLGLGGGACLRFNSIRRQGQYR